MNHPRETALVFRRAAQILQARGHGKGRYSDENGCVCAVGALMAAEGRDPDIDFPNLTESSAVWLLSDRVESNTQDSDPIERIADWNDQPERTLAEVVAELLSAARSIEDREAGAIVPTQMRTADGAVFELATIPAHGDPQYVLAGCTDAPAGVFAEYGELIESFGAVDADEARRLQAGRLAEQRHQVLDLDADSTCPVPAGLLAGGPR